MSTDGLCSRAAFGSGVRVLRAMRNGVPMEYTVSGKNTQKRNRKIYQRFLCKIP